MPSWGAIEMTAADRLIEEIMAASRIPTGRRRREVLRELRAHVEDFMIVRLQDGHTESDVERLLLEQFGDQLQIACQFASVYRRERIALHLAGFLIATALVSGIVSGVAIALQAGLAFGFGNPVMSLFASRHTLIEAINILSTTSVYLGLIVLERFFQRPLAVLAAFAVALLAVFHLIGLPLPFVLFGFANGVSLRMVQVAVRHSVARFFGVLACFATLAAFFFHPSSSALAATAVSWLIMGSAYHLMTRVAARVDRALLGSL
jgi:hypothetical protein